MYPFHAGKRYKRRDVYKIIGVPETTKGGVWDTGYAEYIDDFFLFCNVGVAGRTGHDYPNKFIGPDLHWYAKSHTALHQPQIQKLLNPSGLIYIFFRLSDKDPFTFAGLGSAISFSDQTPVQITWQIATEGNDAPTTSGEQKLFPEGSTKQIIINAYERNPAARAACIEHFGYICQICGFDFALKYGLLGEEFIHVHHIKPLYELDEEYEVDPINDLVPLCPNCHSMVHRKRPAYTIADVRKSLLRK